MEHDFNPIERSKTLQKISRDATPLRMEQLVAMAKNPEKPKKPAPGECCGSSCDPCVMTTYSIELKIWKECWVKYQPDSKDVTDW
jgi:hypothetical protein